MVSKRSFLPMRPRKLWYPYPYLLILMSLSLAPPSSVVARRRYVSFVNSPSKWSSQSLSRHARCKTSRQIEFHQSRVIEFNHDAPTKLFSSSSADIIHVLRKYGFGNRLVTLNNAYLSQHPMIAEIYAEGSMNICLILRWVPPSAVSTSIEAEKPPLLEVLVMNDEGILNVRKVIDIGEPVFMGDVLWSVHNLTYGTSQIHRPNHYPLARC